MLPLSHIATSRKAASQGKYVVSHVIRCQGMFRIAQARMNEAGLWNMSNNKRRHAWEMKMQ
jgi:hypothetical protein